MKQVEIIQVKHGEKDVVVTVYSDQTDLAIKFEPPIADQVEFNKWDDERFRSMESIIAQLIYCGYTIKL